MVFSSSIDDDRAALPIGDFRTKAGATFLVLSRGKHPLAATRLAE